MNSKRNKRNAVIVWIIAAATLLAALITVAVISIDHYIDTHTWATVYITGEINSDTSDAFAEEHEYLKGDKISFAGITLKITDITHDGTVTFSVEQGNLYNKSGEAVNSGVITKNELEHYKIDKGTVYLRVIRNRYQ